jgi:hypothetical protein
MIEMDEILGITHDSYVRRFTIISYENEDKMNEHVRLMIQEGYLIDSIRNQIYKNEERKFVKYYKKISEDNVNV